MDIRYVLFILDKFGGAGYLLKRWILRTRRHLCESGVGWVPGSYTQITQKENHRCLHLRNLLTRFPVVAFFLGFSSVKIMLATE